MGRARGKGAGAGGQGVRSAFAFLQSAAWLSCCIKMAQREVREKEAGQAGPGGLSACLNWRVLKKKKGEKDGKFKSKELKHEGGM